MAAVGDAIDDIGLVNVKDIPPPTVIQPSWDEKSSTSRLALELHHRSSSISSFTSTRDDYRRSGEENENLKVYRSRSISSVREGKLYTPPSTADSGHSSSSRSMNSKGVPVIPRTTSSLSLSRFPIHLIRGKTDPFPSAPPSAYPQPPATSPERTRRLKRKVVGYPQAMSFQEVLKMRTALDRAAGYAEKINELYAEDCGLDAWIATAKSRKKGVCGISILVLVLSSNPVIIREGAARAIDVDSDILSPLKSPTMAASARTHELTRRMSRTSMASEDTFPIRPDAYAATNLRAHSTEDSPPQGTPPSLPYPSLAGIRNRHPSSATSSSGRTGFFASIGRRASLKKERNQVLQAGYRPPAHLPLSTPKSAPRSVQIESTPQIPGGPRAQPRRNSAIMPLFATSISTPRSTPPVSPNSPSVPTAKTYQLSSPRSSYQQPPPQSHGSLGVASSATMW